MERLKGEPLTVDLEGQLSLLLASVRLNLSSFSLTSQLTLSETQLKRVFDHSDQEERDKVGGDERRRCACCA